MNNKSVSLLYDITKLWRKYGKSAFTDLSKLLSQDDFPEEVAHLLDTYMGTVSKQKKTKRKTSPRINVGLRILTNIERMRYNQPEKAELLSLLNEQLMNKEILPTLRDIKLFMINEQLPLTKAISREKAVESLFTLFMDMKINELRGYLNNLPTTPDNYQRSLSRWSDIISKKNINDDELPTIKY